MKSELEIELEKLNGFVALVEKMRIAQKNFYAAAGGSRTKAMYLEQSLRLEREVDKVINEIKNPTFFNWGISDWKWGWYCRPPFYMEKPGKLPGYYCTVRYAYYPVTQIFAYAMYIQFAYVTIRHTGTVGSNPLIPSPILLIERPDNDLTSLDTWHLRNKNI